MSPELPTLHMMCGKIAAGKSTLAAQLARPKGTVLITEDAWLDGLFADQLATPRDYLRCTAKLRAVMGPHVAALLDAGVSVVLDFAANTVDQRAWMRGILEATGAAHRLHLLAPPDEVCLDRLHGRNASGTHPFVVTDEQFHQFSCHFVPPGPEEGFNVVRHES
ncbi:AAA family ATPase [Mameliella sp.]|uniref:AAA family ATPase n=1 Tax=Mameliella sp. TaxID=1924940 RepID=UPI003BAD9E9C